MKSLVFVSLNHYCLRAAPVSRAATRILGRETLLPRTIGDINTLIAITRIIEVGHLISMGAMAYIAMMQLRDNAPAYAFASATTDLVLNAYPIMLQRYQRLRLERLKLHKISKEQQHKSDVPV